VSLRSRVRSSPVSAFFASCWVIVEPPWTTAPASVFSRTARATARASMPAWDRNRASSTAMTASRSTCGMRASGTTSRSCSAWSSARTRPPASTTTLVSACGGRTTRPTGATSTNRPPHPVVRTSAAMSRVSDRRRLRCGACSVMVAPVAPVAARRSRRCRAPAHGATLSVGTDAGELNHPTRPRTDAAEPAHRPRGLGYRATARAGPPPATGPSREQEPAPSAAKTVGTRTSGLVSANRNLCADHSL
jgi:hypothetical protein